MEGTMQRMTIELRPDEKEALSQLALFERRDPRAQAALLVRAELERLGLLGETRRCGGVSLPSTGRVEPEEASQSV